MFEVGIFIFEPPPEDAIIGAGVGGVEFPPPASIICGCFFGLLSVCAISFDGGLEIKSVVLGFEFDDKFSSLLAPVIGSGISVIESRASPIGSSTFLGGSFASFLIGLVGVSTGMVRLVYYL